MSSKSVITEFIPKWIAWEATAKCNLNCIHCRSSSTIESEQGGFTTPEAFKLIDDIASFSSPAFVLSGGEPLLRDDIFDIAKHGTEKGLRVCMASNGTLIDDAVCENMKKSGIRIVSLSLDGASAEVHDNFRDQIGAFEGTLRGIDHLKKHGIDFLINSSFTKRNQAETKKIFSLAKELGATAWYMFLIVPTGRGEEIMEELISADDYEDILDWHYEAELAEREMLMRPTCAPHYYRIA
ncbi:MAG: radical SAM protein, partial [Terriglobia bacterium]